MCYSAQVWSNYKKYVREFGADIDIREFVQVYLRRHDAPKTKLARGMDFAFLEPSSPEEQQIYELIQGFNGSLVSASEQFIFEQKQRRDAALKRLEKRESKTAQNEVRIATKNIEQRKRWISDASRTQPLHERDDRIWPDTFCPVLIVENGRRVVKPMRFHCRPYWMPASSDRTKTGKPSGKYNARRDNLERFWSPLFGQQHGLIVASVFYEQVGPEGATKEVQFRPSTGDDMLIACIWSSWTDPEGKEPDLLSFAAVTDDPEPEVAAAGHDRTVINLKPEYVDLWLNPEGVSRENLQAILEDKRHPYYEHRMAA